MTDPESSGLTIVRGRVCGCAIAFGPEGIVGTRILGDDAEATTAELAAAVLGRRPDLGALLLRPRAGTLGAQLAQDLEAIGRHLEHGDADLRSVRVDWRGASPFRVRVSEMARSIANGEVRTYGELSRALGSSARAVGQAMATNPYPIVVPCHRVVAANGGPGGFTAPGGLVTKDALLRLEGGRLSAAPTQLGLPCH